VQRVMARSRPNMFVTVEQKGLLLAIGGMKMLPRSTITHEGVAKFIFHAKKAIAQPVIGEEYAAWLDGNGWLWEGRSEKTALGCR